MLHPFGASLSPNKMESRYPIGLSHRQQHQTESHFSYKMKKPLYEVFNLTNLSTKYPTDIGT